MRGLTRDCIVEMFDRKVVYMFAGVALITVLVTLFVPTPEIEIQVQGNTNVVPMADWVWNPVTKALSLFLSFMLFLAVLATAGLIPNMLGRRKADFYLSKPLSRTALFLNKMVGVWLVYGATFVLCGLAVYAVIWLRVGHFDWKVLYLFAFTWVSFFIWLSITATVGVISGSGAISIMSAFLFWVAQAILKFHEQIKAFLESRPVSYIVDVLYYIVPKSGEIGDLTLNLALGRPVESWMPLYSSLVFSVALVAFAVMVFKRKSY